MRNLYLRLPLPNNLLLFASVAKFERLQGMNSNIGGGEGHFVFIDCDTVPLSSLLNWCRQAQRKWALGTIYVTSDGKPDSYRVWCFTVVSLRGLIKIISDCPYTDIDFIRWTARKGHATMRLTAKQGRGEQEIVATLTGREEPLPPQVEIVEYETPHGPALRLGYKVMADG